MDMYAYDFDVAYALANAPAKLFHAAEKAMHNAGISVRPWRCAASTAKSRS
jgi:hypothetical protein